MTAPENTNTGTNIIYLHGKPFRLYKREHEIQEAVARVAAQINADYAGARPLLLPLLNGAFVFAADLIRCLTIDCELSFVKVASYTGTQSSGQLHTLVGLAENISGRHVIIVEDIVDTGHTLARLLPELQAKNPASLKIASLLVKPEALNNRLEVHYTGMEIPNDFIVGYGLDYDGLGRNLCEIYQAI
ncbi:MAG: hypoxanthine phosphoribosyltransferase [Chitinophagales bacterium]|nr:hypoxanthine phosphoribosyltransferase [Chitinophagales bacterium]MDW8418462.1 hypoxanthine phosphoribosyltransferase [Chitinophagales bacterium]